MIILIDGDNRPKACLKGIENLQKKDILYILYNETNIKAYTSKFKADIIKKSKAKVKFVKINTNSKNGVDFASFLGDEAADKICGNIKNQLNQCTQLTETN